MTIKVFEAFSGVGAQRMALRKIGVAHEVVAISEIDKYAIKSYEAIHGEVNNLGDISKIEVDNIPDHDLFTYSFPCFTGDTLVLTDSGYKRINEICIGDKVLTHTNQYKKVTNIFNQGVKNIVNVNGMSVHNIKTTENHKFLTRKRYRLLNKDKRAYEIMFHNPQWVEAKNLTKDHYLGLAINQESTLPIWEGYLNDWGNEYGYHTNVISDLLENNDFWWLMGRYVADGRHLQQGGILIDVPDVKLKEFENKVNNLFYYLILKEHMVNKVHIPNKELQVFTEQFGYYDHNKKISPEVLNLPVHLLKSFVEGYFSGDGSYSEDSKLYRCSTTSQELIYGIGQCIAKVYHRPYSIYKQSTHDNEIIEGRIVNQRDIYSLHFKTETDIQDRAFYEDGHIWFPFNGLEYKGKEIVYDIEVEDDHSFTVFNTIVHNCQDISLAGKQKGLSEDSGTRSSLLWECKRIIENKKPKYLLMENVKNLVGKKFKADFDKWLDYLESLGYTNYWKVLNAKDYGIPQNRERVFCVSIYGEHDPYEFPEPIPLELRLKDVLEVKVDEKFYLDDERASQLTFDWSKMNKNVDLKVVTNTSATNYNKSNVYHTDGISHTIAARDYKGPNQILEMGKYGLNNTQAHRIGGIFDKDGKTHQAGAVWDKEGLAPTLDTMHGGWRQPSVVVNNSDSILIKNATKKGYLEAFEGDGVDLVYPKSKARRGRVQSGLIQTLDTGSNKGVVVAEPLGTLAAHNSKKFGSGYMKNLSKKLKSEKHDISVVYSDLRIRKLTPLECWRLMGFSDEDFEKAQAVNSNSQLYKQAGNSIVVNVLEGIFKEMFIK